MKYCPKCQQTYLNTQRFCPNDGERISLQDPYRLVGQTLVGKYQLEALIGIGGMGAVYCAHHISINRRVAFKILLPNLSVANERINDLFEREAKLAGQLAHENIVNISDAGRTADGLAYIAMEWLDGNTLEEEIAAHGPLSFERTAALLHQIAAALQEAHSNHIVHRDLKPSNVMLVRQPNGREQVKVLDFGISKAINETKGSAVSAMMGTPHYASPEQFQVGGQIDRRTDIYSLGVMIYQMLTGALPFDAASIPRLIQLHLTEPPPPLRRLRPEASSAVEQLVNCMLAKEPELRPQYAAEIPALFEHAIANLNEAEFKATTVKEASPFVATSGKKRDMNSSTSESHRPTSTKEQDPAIMRGTDASFPSLDSLRTFKLPESQVTSRAEIGQTTSRPKRDKEKMNTAMWVLGSFLILLGITIATAIYSLNPAKPGRDQGAQPVNTAFPSPNANLESRSPQKFPDASSSKQGGVEATEVDKPTDHPSVRTRPSRTKEQNVDNDQKRAEEKPLKNRIDQ